MKIAGIRFKKDAKGYPDFRNITYIKRAILNKELYNLRQVKAVNYLLGKEYLPNSDELKQAYYRMQCDVLFRQRAFFPVLRKISRIENW